VPCLALPCPALSCLVLPCLALPCLVLHCLALSCLALPCLIYICLLSIYIHTRTLNYEQLLGLQRAYADSANNAKSLPWRLANVKLLEKVNIHIIPRREESILNAAKKEEKSRTAHVKSLTKRAKDKEKHRVMDLIHEKAAAAAVIEVKEDEFKRQTEEKVNICLHIYPFHFVLYISLIILIYYY
jgi:hypothetical protein